MTSDYFKKNSVYELRVSSTELKLIHQALNNFKNDILNESDELYDERKIDLFCVALSTYAACEDLQRRIDKIDCQ